MPGAARQNLGLSASYKIGPIGPKEKFCRSNNDLSGQFRAWRRAQAGPKPQKIGPEALGNSKRTAKSRRSGRSSAPRSSRLSRWTPPAPAGTLAGMATYTYADEFLWLLKGCGAEGMTVAAIGRRMRHRPPSAQSVDAALKLLRERGWSTCPRTPSWAIASCPTRGTPPRVAGSRRRLPSSSSTSTSDSCSSAPDAATEARRLARAARPYDGHAPRPSLAKRPPTTGYPYRAV